MKVSDATFTRFVPMRLVRRHQIDPTPPAAMTVERCQGAVLFADIIGYTALTESFSRQGPEGIEQLRVLVNSFFDRLNNSIMESGGDIISFAGDSVLALWTAKPGNDIAQAIRLAVQCSDRVIGLRGETSIFTEPLLMRVGISAGDLLLGTVGGIDERWEYVAMGEPMSKIGTLMRHAEPGRVVIERNAWRHISHYCAGSAFGDGDVQLSEILSTIPTEHLVVPNLREDTKAALRSYIPSQVLDHLDAGDFDWLSEFRRPCVLFAGVPDIDAARQDTVVRMQAVVEQVQLVLRRYQGTLVRVIVDDKGANVLSVWGIPGRGHESDPVRAVSAGIEMHDRLSGLGLSANVGIAAGRALCGLTGGGPRYEYTVTGNAINLAARLMGEAQGGILCDQAIRDAAMHAIDFGPSEPIYVKGREGPIQASRPQDAQIPRGTHLGKNAESAAPEASRFIGRRRELAVLVGKLTHLRDSVGSMVTIEGEPGVGKSRLVSAFMAIAEATHVNCLIGRADDIESNTTYYTWRAVLTQVLEHHHAVDAQSRRAHLQALFDGTPRLQSWLPLLNDVMPLGFAATIATEQLSEQGRAESTVELMVHILRSEAIRCPTLVVLEDVHWMDSLSWNIAEHVQRRVAPLMLVLVSRDDHEVTGDAAKRLALLPANECVILKPLERGDVEALLRNCLSVDYIAPDIVSYIYSKTDGNPLFSEELARALRDDGCFEPNTRRCEFASDRKRFDKFDQLTTVEEVIVSRIDLMAPPEQFTIKVASVIGRTFPASLMEEIHPVRWPRAVLSQQFANLIASNLVQSDDEAGERRFAFKHAIMQDVTYKMLAPQTRIELHRSIAQWYEATNDADLSPVYPLLAHHWKKANDRIKAATFLHGAGKQALARFANRDAADFLDDALEVLADRHDEVATRQRSECVRLLGFARLWLGELTKSHASLQQGLALLGSPIPSSRRALYFGILREFITWIRVSVVRACIGPRVSKSVAASKDAAIGMLRLGHIAYLNGDILLSIYTSLRCLNFVERCEPSSEMAIIFAAMASAAGMIPAHALARRYSRLALTAGESINDDATTAQVLLYTSMYGAGVAHWQACIPRVQRAVSLSRLVGDRRRTEECLVVSGYLHFHSGRFHAALENYEELTTAARARGDRQTTAWGLLGVARVRLFQGLYIEALRSLEDALPLVGDAVSNIELHGQMAIAYSRSDAFDQALAAARTGLAILTKSPPISFTTLTGTAGIAQALLELTKQSRLGRSPYDPSSLGADARRALHSLRVFARIFPIGTPQAFHQRGVYCSLVGKHERAAELWTRGLESAAALEMPHEEAHIAVTMATSACSLSAAARVRAKGLLRQLGIAEERLLPPAIGG